MFKTSLFAEILVIGYMGCVWLAMLMIWILGPPTEQLLLEARCALRDGQILITFGLTAFAYFVGILIDQLADVAIGLWDRRIRIAIERGESPSMLEMQAYLFTQVPEAVDRYEYIQKRLRISRAAVFNVAAVLLIAPFLGLENAHLRAIIIVGSIIWCSAVFSYYLATRFYWERLGREYRIVASQKDKSVEQEA